MNEMMRMGFLTGILVGGIGILLFWKLTKKDGSRKCIFDERQQIVRGQAFKYGFFGWMIFDGLCILADTGLQIQYMDKSMELFSGMLVGLIIYGSYSIWHDGYISLNENPKRIMAILTAAALLNMACAAWRIQEGLLENEILTFLNGANLFVCMTAVLFLILMLVKRNRDRT